MRKSTSGFTIVELLIVIVVIAILAAITIVAYDGIQTRAVNSARIAELNAWEKHFAIYKATYGSYPDVPETTYCLGYGFENGVCQNASGANAWLESNNTPLMNELEKVGSLPTGPRDKINNFGAPYARYNAGSIQITAAVEGDGGECPSGTNEADVYAPLILCRVVLQR